MADAAKYDKASRSVTMRQGLIFERWSPSIYRGRLLNAEGEAPISRLNAAANLLGLLYPALIAAAEMLSPDRSAFDAASIRRLRT